MARLDQERQNRLEPRRMEVALSELKKLGIQTTNDETKIQFVFNGHPVTYYPYSGWATGKSIKDGRGLKKLLQQLN